MKQMLSILLLGAFSIAASAQNLGQELLARFNHGTHINIEQELGVWTGHCVELSSQRTRPAFWVLKQSVHTALRYQSFEAPYVLYNTQGGQVLAVAEALMGDHDLPSFWFDAVAEQNVVNAGKAMTAQTIVGRYSGREVWFSAVKKSENYLVVAVMRKEFKTLSDRTLNMNRDFAPTEMCYFHEKSTGVSYYDQDVTARYYHSDHNNRTTAGRRISLDYR